VSIPRLVAPKPPPEPDDFRMPLIEHLKELRQRLIRAIGAVLVGIGVSLFYTDEIIAWLRAPLDDALLSTGVQGGLALVNSPFEGVSVWMRVAVLGGLALASPVVAYQGWAFVAPGLYQQERRVVVPLTLSSTGLFLGGGLFCYYVVLPRTFPFLLQVVEVTSALSLEGYLASMVQIMIAFGLCFQLPVVTWFLARMGLIDHRDLIRFFRYAIVAIFVVAAVVTPDSSMITQVFLAGPLTLLYGVSIGVAWVFSTKKRPPPDGPPAG
jgi:sec-independent protein translocase protein TatC